MFPVLFPRLGTHKSNDINALRGLFPRSHDLGSRHASRAREIVRMRARIWDHQFTWEHGNKSLKSLRLNEKAVPEHGNKLGNMGTNRRPLRAWLAPC